ncbi:phospholipase [Arsenicibacter rosenii]|uniref:Phospholipase n=2 Tax=Arsenicibacter rosenii TaxID=1750698 RepID=A0A1S2VTL4_9BACT|nr:phospholipase [Arsenicibacter rosenii]
MATEHHLTVTRTARFHTLGGDGSGERPDSVTNIWFVLHGYGQLARYFIRKFDVIADEHTLVVAPEALSRFYLDTEFNRMGASWLTREDRDQEVADYVAYLDTLYTRIMQDRDPASVKITLLGFSQGGATACRWVTHGKVSCDRLILWAGYFANGLTDVLPASTAAQLPVTYVYGRQDEYIEQMPDPDAYIMRIKQDMPHVQIDAFEGKHVIDRDVLKRYK